MVTLLLGFLGRNWIAIAAAALIGVSFAYARIEHSSALSSRNQAASSDAALRQERAAIAAEREAWSAKINAVSSAAAADVSRVSTDLSSARRSADLRVATVLDSLHRAAAAHAASPLKPAGDSPEPCRSYAADPALLPERDQQLLARLGDRADRILLERNACISAYNAISRRFLDAEIF